MRKLTLFLASNAGLGYAPFASGTFGTLAGIPVFYLTGAWPWWLYMITMTALLFLSFWVADAAGQIVGAGNEGLTFIWVPQLFARMPAGNLFMILFFLALVGAVMTAALGWVGEGDWPLALGVYLVASIGYYTSTVFYDSLLIDVTSPRYYSFVSTLGSACGYLGGAVLLGVHLWMVRSPATFGLENATEALNLALLGTLHRGDRAEGARG